MWWASERLRGPDPCRLPAVWGGHGRAVQGSVGCGHWETARGAPDRSVRDTDRRRGMSDKAEFPDSVWDYLADKRVLFWTCPQEHDGIPGKPNVEWRGDVAYCLHPDCGQRSNAEVYAVVTEYRVSALPTGHRSGQTWAVWVQWRGQVDGVDVYCVADTQNGTAQNWHQKRLDWVWEPIPSERREDFIAATRFPLPEALRIGRFLAPH